MAAGQSGKTLKVGMVGYNDGNGHPYSFSAIINGYNADAMKHCPYEVIYNYLEQQPKTQFGIGNLEVTHIWTPFQAISEDIAKCTHIGTVCNTLEEMAAEVDAVIIARDDAESHRDIAKLFLDKGIKVFVDKPLCNHLDDLSFFEPYVRGGQVMSASGFRYMPAIASEFDGELKKEDLVYAHCNAMVEWSKYGIHLIEGVTPLFGSDIKSVQNIGEENNDVVRIEYHSGKYVLISLNTGVWSGFRANIFSNSKAHFSVHFNDNFNCFRNLLFKVNDFFSSNEMPIHPEETITLIKTLIAAKESRIRGGEKITIS